jgi:hypothetical protein
MKHTRKSTKWTLSIVLAIALSLVVVMGASAAVWTDQPDYPPGSVVTISGDNRDGAGYQPGETVHVDVAGPNGYATMCEGVADDAGAWSCQVTLWANDLAVGAYTFTAAGQSSGVQEVGGFLDDNGPGSLQCTGAQTLNNTHYKLPVGTTITCQIVGATNAYDGNHPGIVDVTIKSSALGNTTIQGTLSGDTITFSYTAPANGCETTVVSYASYTVNNQDRIQVGESNTDNDIILDGVDDDKGNSPGGLAYTVNGEVPSCSSTPPKDLTVTKTAAPSFTRSFDWTIDKSADHDLFKTAGSATFNYTIAVVKDAGTDSDWQLDGVITVNNPNSFDVTGVNVTDALCAVSNADNMKVPANGSVSVPYTCAFDANPGSGTNTATATWVSYGSPGTSASGTAPFAFGEPTTIVNGSVTVNDSNGQSWVFTDTGSQTYPVTYAKDPAGTCTDHTNTATILQTQDSASKTVKVCVGADLTVSKTAVPSFKRTYTWDISKAVDKTLVRQSAVGATFNYTVNAWQTGFADSDWKVSGEITVNNPNDWEAITADLSDVVSNGGVCTLAESRVTVPAGGSVKVGYTCTYASAPTGSAGINSGGSIKNIPPSGPVNTATATWDATAFFTPGGNASGTANFAFTTPTSTENKTIYITDTYAGDLGTLTATDGEPYASGTFTYSREAAGVPGTCKTFDNTAAIVGTNESASQTVTLCVGADLTVSKTAVPSFTRTYDWDPLPTKEVDKTQVNQVGGNATFNYTVNAWQTGFTDSGWAVTGVVTVKNPNDWEEVTAGLADTVDNGGLCTLDSSSVTVPKGGSVDVSYSCTFGSGLSGTNTAAATWDKKAFFTPSNTASGSADFAFTAPTTRVNQTITVKDTFNGVTTVLGTLTAADGEPYASAEYTYSKTVPIPAWDCVLYANTVGIDGSKLTTTVEVKACGPAKTGGLTMGFWQNKNGQAIITGSASTSGVCNLATWLRQYAPFQDLSATAKCSAAGSYVTSVIKAANASGASMNAMLKAQMLASALDVYFSDPALGGNKINAPRPLGGVQILLTNVCKPTGAGCGDSSPAFGGAASLSVSQLLAYAAGQSSAGGSLWYGNDKAIQELAKNTFDAINNQVAFADPGFTTPAGPLAAVVDLFKVFLPQVNR